MKEKTIITLGLIPLAVKTIELLYMLHQLLNIKSRFIVNLGNISTTKDKGVS